MTSEYVTIGHPDRTADFISEYILDRYLERDPYTRYALEVQIKDDDVSLGGEVTSKAHFYKDELTKFVKDALRRIGYDEEYADKWGASNTIDPRLVEVRPLISLQSPDIAQGVDADGWGDQGIFWGMAVNDQKTGFMPRDWWLARRIGELLYSRRYGGLDIKTQVTIDGGKVKRVIVAIPLLERHEKAGIGAVEMLAKSICGQDAEVIVNGTGRYVRHSSIGDCGTTGRKLAVDFYGGNCRIGGGSPWTKDPTKADLTLNLYARKKALDYVKSHGIAECHCQIASCIGRAEIEVALYDGNMKKLDSYVEKQGPAGLIEKFDLRRPIYAETALKGLFWNIK